MPDAKQRADDESIERTAMVSDVVEPPARNALTETSGVWSALAAYFGPAHVRPSVQPEVSPWQDEDDFSAEHGYEPGFEGRSEFEHGEFDRWL
jgi:hypothetical protein